MQIAPPTVALTPPYGGTFTVYDPAHFNLPYTTQWNVALEQGVGTSQSLIASYVGNIGRRYLRAQIFNSPNSKFAGAVTVFRSDSTSDYEALQMQFQRRLSRGLQILASYTLAHALDDSSVDANCSCQPTRGDSKFDVRHGLSGAVSYEIPSGSGSRVARRLLGDWGVDAIEHALSGAPVDLSGGTLVLGTEQITLRPDVVPGVPFYVADPTVPGGQRFNNTAFVKAPAGRQGTLGRNVLRGPAMSQLDLALRRQFRLMAGLKLQFRVEAFNVLNHPNFGALNTSVGSATLGVPTQMLGRALAGTSGGLSPLYQVGGPRSFQFSLRLNF
jgi:hypothetical protein